MKYHTLRLRIVMVIFALSNLMAEAAGKNYREMSCEDLILSYQDNSDSREMALAYKDKGSELINQGRMVDALRMLVLGMIVSERGGHDDIYSTCASNLGVIYGYFGEYGSSAFYNELSFKSSEKRGDAVRARISANNLLQTYCNMSDMEGAERIYKWLEANSSSEEDNGFRGTFNAYTFYTAAKKYVEAHKYAELLYGIVGRDGMPISDRGASLLVLGESMLNLNKYEDAFVHAASGLNIAEKEKLTGLQLEAYSLIAKIASAKGDENGKNHYIRIKGYLEDSVMNKNRYYSEKQKLLDLQQQSVLKSLHLLNTKISHQKQIIIIVIVVLVLSVVVLYIIVRMHVRLKKAYRVLYDKNENWLKETSKQPMLCGNDNGNHSRSDGVTENLPVSEQFACLDDSSGQKVLLDKIVSILDNPETIRNSDFNLEMLVRMVGSNTHYVSGLINSTFGTNFSNYLNERRVRLCCSMIKANPDIKIADLWPQTGFGTQRNFQRSFKEIIGMPPSAYKPIVKDSIDK